MSRVDLHPEELLDRARSGKASNEELARARAHIASCAACSIEQTLLVEIERSVAPQPHDELVAARVRAFVARKVKERSQLRADPAQRRGARKWAVLAFAATLLLTTIGAAMVMLREHRRTAEQAKNDSVAAISPPVARAHEVGSVAPDEGASGAQNQPEATVRREDTVGGRAAPRAPRAAPKPERAQAANESASELFARANLLRRRDDVSEAASVYRELQRSFPGSAEDLLSRVVLGRLLLDRLGDPGAALAQFDSYLAHASQGSLREEAMVGRAVALGRLGRAAEERSAWGALLEAYPKSTSAARARAKLAAPTTP